MFEIYKKTADGHRDAKRMLGIRLKKPERGNDIKLCEIEMSNRTNNGLGVYQAITWNKEDLELIIGELLRCHKEM